MKREALRIAIDFSGREFSVAVGRPNQDELVGVWRRPATGRHAAGLLPWMLDKLRKAGVELKHIDQWVIGSGPGSFTGLRLAASLVAGLSRGIPGAEVKAVPSGLALAAMAESSPGAKSAVLFPGFGGETLIYGVVNEKSKGLIPNPGHASARTDELSVKLTGFEHLVIRSQDRDKLASLLDDSRLVVVNEFPIEKLLFSDHGSWGLDALAEMEYIRPASNAKPTTPRRVG